MSENTETTVDLVAVAKDLNTGLGLDPEIDTTLPEEELLAAIKQESTQVGQNIKTNKVDLAVAAADEQALSPETWSFLQEQGFLKHIEDARAAKAPKAKPAKAGKPAGEGKPAKADKPAGEKKGGFVKSPHAEERNKFIESLIAEGKHTAVEILDKVLAKFPEEKRTSVQTIISDSKNEKYTKFGKVAKANDQKILSF